MKTTQDNSATAPSPEKLAGELQGIREELTAIRAELAHKQDAEKKEKHSSKTALTIGFGLVGLKIGGLIGGHLGFVRHFAATHHIDKWDFKTIRKALKNTGNHMMSGEMFNRTLIWGGIGSVIGAVGGIMLGWMRGDRIEKPTDLLTKPIDSMEKLFGSAPVKADSEPETATKSWQNRITEKPPQSAGINV